MSKDKEPDILSIFLDRFGSKKAIIEYRMHESGIGFCVYSEKIGEDVSQKGLMDEYERIGRNLSALYCLINNDKAMEEHKQNADDLEYHFFYHMELRRLIMKNLPIVDMQDLQRLYLSYLDRKEKNKKHIGGEFEVITEDSPLYKQEKDMEPDERD